MLATLLSQLDGVTGGGARIKCVPSYVAPDLVKLHFKLFPALFSLPVPVVAVAREY